jgi:hypothetical protein
MSTCNQPPFKIGDLVEFIEDPASGAPERVAKITWIEAPMAHWEVETVWQLGGREQRRIVDAAELRAGFALNSTYVAFKSVVRWALTLGLETGKGRISEATMARIVEGAWLAFDTMEGAQLDVPVDAGNPWHIEG